MTEPEEPTNPPESRICHECGTTIAAGVEECPRCALAAELGSKGFDVNLEALAAELPQLEILEEIGRGGMGVVFKARQKSLGREVALKILPKELDYDPGFSERFLRESRTLAGLSHPHVVAVHDAGQAAGHHYLLMEYVDGTDLAKLMKAGDVQPKQALSIVSQICEALQYAHDQGVVHRDIKPGNILLDRAGLVKLGDFGLAKLVQSDDSMRLTGTLQAMGTPHYMAPEQIERPLEVDHRADLYSLGVVLYELLTGELPIGRFPVPSKKADIDVRLDEVVMKTLEKEPELRYQSASEVRLEVDRASSRAVGLAPAGTTAPEMSAQVGEKRGIPGPVIAAILLTTLGLVFMRGLPLRTPLLWLEVHLGHLFFPLLLLLPVLMSVVSWLVFRSKKMGRRYGRGLVLLVFAAPLVLGVPSYFILVMSLGSVPGVAEIITALLVVVLFGGAAVAGWMMMRSAKKERAVSTGEPEGEKRVSTASYIAQDDGTGKPSSGLEARLRSSAEAVAGQTLGLAGDAMDVAEKQVSEARAELGETVDAEPGEKKKTSVVIQSKSGFWSKIGCCVLIAALITLPILFFVFMVVGTFRTATSAEGTQKRHVRLEEDSVEQMELEVVERKLEEAEQQIERFRETTVQKVAKDRESVFAIKGREILLADWFQEQHEVTAFERWRVETRLEDTFLQYFRLERENTTVKRLLNESLVVEVRKFLPDEVVSEEVRSVLDLALGERGQSIDWEQTKELPWGRGTLKLTFVPFEEDFSSTSFPTLAGTTPRQFRRTNVYAMGDWPWGISVYLHGEHEVHCERFIPREGEEWIALYADGLGLTPTGKVQLGLDFDGVGRWEEFLRRRWMELLAIEEKLVERSVDSDDIHHARLRDVGEWGEEILEELGRSDQPNDPFARWAYEFSEEARTLLPSHLSGKMNMIKGKAYHECTLWTDSFNPRMISIQRVAKSRRSIDEWNDTEAYLVRISYFDTEAKTLGPFLELPVQYARYYEEPPSMFVGEPKNY